MGNLCPGSGQIRLPDEEEPSNSRAVPETPETEDIHVTASQPSHTADPSPLQARSLQDEGTAKVFWDIENCAVPANIPPALVVRNILSLKTSRGYSPSRIVATVAMDKLPLNVKEALTNCDVDLLDCSSTKPSASDFLLLEEMHQWTFHHPPASTGIILISSDRDFGRRLSFLRKVGYDLMLVHGRNITETLTFIVEHRMLWQDVCRLHLDLGMVSPEPPLSSNVGRSSPVTVSASAHVYGPDSGPRLALVPTSTPQHGEWTIVRTSTTTYTAPGQPAGLTNAPTPGRPSTWTEQEGGGTSQPSTSPSSPGLNDNTTPLIEHVQQPAVVYPTAINPSAIIITTTATVFNKTWLDFFVVYGLLYWIDQLCVHLVPNHSYPESTSNGLLAMQAFGLVVASSSLGSNPPHEMTSLFLTKKGHALLTLLNAVNLATSDQNGRRAFRPAVYFWIQSALTSDNEDLCRVSVLGGKIKPLITAGTLKDQAGLVFKSVGAYFQTGASKGVFTLTPWRTTGDYIVKLKSPFSSAWKAFKAVADQARFSSEVWSEQTACGPDVVESVIDTLSSWSHAETLFLPVILVQLEAKSSRMNSLYQLNKMLGYSVGGSLLAAVKAGLIVGGVGVEYRLTASGRSVIQRFDRAVGRSSH